MSQLFAVFKEYLLWSLMLWVVVFVTFAAMFAGGRLTPFARGLWRIFVAVFASPFVFIRKATGTILSFDREREETYRAGDQYLLNKGMLVVQAIVIVAAIGAIAGAIVATWHAWVPPSEVRAAAREYRPKVEEQRTTAANAAAEVLRLDSEWSTKEASVVRKYRDERQKAIAAATAAMGAIEKDLAAYDGVGSSIVQWAKDVPEYRDTSSKQNIAETKRRFTQTAYSNWWSMSAWGRDAVQRWIDRWQVRAIAHTERDNVPIDWLRSETQPGYFAAREKSEAAAQTLAVMEQSLAAREEAASLKWKAAAWRALVSFASILLFVWMSGIAIEAGWLMIRVAGDLRRLREVADAAQTPEPEPRMPIRAAVVPQPLPAAPPAPA